MPRQIKSIKINLSCAISLFECVYWKTENYGCRSQAIFIGQC